MPMLAGVRIVISGHPEKVQLVADVLGMSFPDRIDWHDSFSAVDGQPDLEPCPETGAVVIEVTGTFVRLALIDENSQELDAE